MLNEIGVRFITYFKCAILLTYILYTYYMTYFKIYGRLKTTYVNIYKKIWDLKIWHIFEKIWILKSEKSEKISKFLEKHIKIENRSFIIFFFIHVEKNTFSRFRRKFIFRTPSCQLYIFVLFPQHPSPPPSPPQHSNTPFPIFWFSILYFDFHFLF